MRKKEIIRPLLLLLVAVGFTLSACENVQPDQETIVSIRPRTIPNFPFEGGSFTVNVRTNQADFDFSIAGEWVTSERITPDSIRLTVPAYDGFVSRSTELVISAGKGDLRITRRYTIIQATQYNMAFEQEDVDDDGWLWLNTVTKVNKYVGEDKLIMPTAATHGAKEPTLFSDIIQGADTTGTIEGADDSKLFGAIRLAKSSALIMGNDGGGIEIEVGSCSSIELYLSSEATMRVGLYQALGETGNFAVVKLYGGGFQSSLAQAGHYKWNVGVEGKGEILKGGKQTIRLVNMTNKYLYIHGIKLLY